MWDGGAGKEDRMRGTGTRFEGRPEREGVGGSAGNGCWRCAICSCTLVSQSEQRQCGHKNIAVKVM